MTTFTFGTTVSGLAIQGHRFGTSGAAVLILGGVHGNEPEGVVACAGLLQQFQESYAYKLRVTLVPMLNTDGVLKGTRKNARGVDLNRNLPTRDWTAKVAEEKYFPGSEPLSEPENKALVNYISSEKPAFIISMHSFANFMLLDNNSLCQPECEILHKLTQYPIKNDIGYPTPGALGTYGSFERNIPTLTYELFRGMDFSEILRVHVPAIREALKITEKRF
jgi:murein peptide amidase A